MPGKILLSTAYLPPIEYFYHILNADEVLIEKKENYLKQTYRNRCYILSTAGQLTLTVPVFLGSFHKTPLKDIKIDYSKRWQQVHLGALTASYSASPFFLYFFETIKKIILNDHEFLLDLNLELLRTTLKIIRLDKKISFTTDFKPARKTENDFRYEIYPKKRSHYVSKRYQQVFVQGNGFIPGLSIVDLIFNVGPDTIKYL